MPSIEILAQVYSSSDSGARIEFWAAIGAVFGVVLFVRGFKMLRFKRLILSTPSSKVRSAAMGLVELTGMAKGPHTIPAGITGEACFYYRAMAWQLTQSGRSSQWVKVADESLYVPFFIEDSTGRMLVNPQGAELDIHRNFQDEIGTSFFVSGMMPSNVSSYLTRNGLAGSESTRIEEYCIKPDYPLFVFGTLGTNPLRGLWAPVAQTPKLGSFKSRLNPFGPSSSFGLQALGASIGIATETSMIQPSRVSVSLVNTNPPHQPALSAPQPAPTSWSVVSMDEAGMAQIGSAIARHAASAAQGSRAGSAVAVSDRPSAPVPATLSPVPPTPSTPQFDANGFEINPSVAVGKGASGAPFTISCKSQREVVTELAWKSSLCIWGGPVLTLVCLYILSTSFGWISI
jgi:hypothetical protein